MKTEQILKILKVVAWFIFIGLCAKTVGMIISVLFSHLVNIDIIKSLYADINLYELYSFNRVHYFIMVSLIVILAALKAYLFFWLIKIFSGINITNPFSMYIANIVLKMSKISLQIGITAFIANIYAQWLMKHQIHFTYEGGETEFLFFAAILFVVYQVFKKGIELQRETDLTI